MKTKYVYLFLSLVPLGLSLNLIPPANPTPQVKQYKNLYDINRKTVLDLGNSFKNVTHFAEHDITIVKRESSTPQHVRNLGPVVIVPGLDMTGLSIFPNAIRLSEKRDVIIILAGYSKQQSLKTLCDCLVTYIVSQDMNSVALVGESFGAIMSILIENRLRKRISSMILINPATSYHRTSWSKRIFKIRKHNRRLSHHVVKHGPDWGRILEAVSEFSETHSDHVYNYILSHFMMILNILVTDQEKVFERIESYLNMTQSEIDQVCRKNRTNTTIIVGKNDRMLPSSREADRLKKIMERAEQVKVVKIENANHMLSSNDLNLTDFL